MVKLNLGLINEENIEKVASELETYEEYIPFLLESYINIVRRIDFLNAHPKIRDKIQKVKSKKRREYKLAEDKIQWLQDDVIKWVKQNPEYKEILAKE